MKKYFYTNTNLFFCLFFLSIFFYFKLINGNLAIGNDTSVGISLLFDFYNDLISEKFKVSLIDQTRYLGYKKINDYFLFFNPVYFFFYLYPI